MLRLLVLCFSTVSAWAAHADVYRIDFTAVVSQTSPSRPTVQPGQQLQGYVIYETRAFEVVPGRFENAVYELTVTGLITQTSGEIVVHDSRAPANDLITFSAGAANLRFIGASSLTLDGRAIPVPFPTDWLAIEFFIEEEIAYTLADVTSYSSTLISHWEPEFGIFHVASQGNDSPICGGSAHPCRSISQAIRNAHDGDTIVVTGGLYGDLNRNGLIGEPGEESGAPGCDCLIYVDKRLTILSDEGSSATIIDATRTSRTAVTISATDALFGHREQGFTVLGASDGFGSGVVVMPGHSAGIGGNRIVGGWRGIEAERAHVYDNEITDTRGPAGIAIAEGNASNNAVLRNQNGIVLGRGSAFDNEISDNRGTGLTVSEPAFARVIGNAFRRNRGPGLFLARGSGSPKDVSVTDNRFIGNDFDGYASNPTLHCGVENDSGGLVWAVENEWAGAADANVSNQVACDGPGSTTVTQP